MSGWNASTATISHHDDWTAFQRPQAQRYLYRAAHANGRVVVDDFPGHNLLSKDLYLKSLSALGRLFLRQDHAALPQRNGTKLGQKP